MSLIVCSECGKEISDKAAACPHCGNPVAAKQNQSVAKSRQRKRKTGCLIPILFAIALCVIFVIAVIKGMGDSSNASASKSILGKAMDLTDEQEQDMLAIFESCGIVELKEVTQFQAGDEHTSYYVNDDETEHYASVNNTIVVWIYNDSKAVEAIYFHDHDIYVDGTVVAQVSDYYIPSSLRDEYRVAAQLLVKQCLNYPDTAEFGSRSTWDFGVSEDGYDGVHSSVTAKNAYGVQSTEEFQILFNRDTGEAVSLNLGGTEYIHQNNG